ncbi:MAG: hypothetical protein K2X03_15590 [Bryobacteraceae bacterium]|nr:hypothetical protein [Bryobacteraceae bacterium]
MSTLTFTQLIHQGRAGDASALSRAYDLVAIPLRRTAARLLDRERRGHTLQPTALVNEFYLRLLRMECHIQNREHFLGLAARSMRHFLIDCGRVKAVRLRHEPDVLAAHPLVTKPLTAEELAARHAWEALQRQEPLAAETYWLLTVERMTAKEVVAIQQRPAWRVNQDAAFARDWMHAKLR